MSYLRGMIVIRTIFWIIVGIIALYITILVIAFFYNIYLLASGKMTKEELNYKVQINKEKQKKEKAKKIMEKKRKKANKPLHYRRRRIGCPINL